MIYIILVHSYHSRFTVVNIDTYNNINLLSLLDKVCFVAGIVLVRKCHYPFHHHLGVNPKIYHDKNISGQRLQRIWCIWGMFQPLLGFECTSTFLFIYLLI